MLEVFDHESIRVVIRFTLKLFETLPEFDGEIKKCKQSADLYQNVFKCKQTADISTKTFVKYLQVHLNKRFEI